MNGEQDRDKQRKKKTVMKPKEKKYVKVKMWKGRKYYRREQQRKEKIYK